MACINTSSVEGWNWRLWKQQKNVSHKHERKWKKWTFDDVPANHKEVCVKRGSMLSLADPREQEQEHDNVAEECDKIENEELSIHVKSQREFGNLSDNNAHSASMFIMKYQYDK